MAHAAPPGLRLGLRARVPVGLDPRFGPDSGIVGAGRQPAAPAPPAPFAPKAPGHGFRTGQRVFHNKFGEGVIVTLEGSGADARAQIAFGRHGSKWLALGIAKLTPVE